MSVITISVAQFGDLLQKCFLIRKQVFVVEQNVPEELEVDEYDRDATHFLLSDDCIPIATARLIDKNGLAKIGRVAVIKQERGKGYGLELMRFVMTYAKTAGFSESVLDAQTYAVPFYERLGYVVEGNVFDDAGIPHLHMRGVLKA